ncbi:MAG: hypothetical protein DRQ47_09245 [Gammaproteobacteria bacterium]|nr:MAG: hypothetical protein DRQ47_09245 [Gammaproteobacteria bacterium]
MDSLISRSITPEVMVNTRLSDELWNTKIDPGNFEDMLLNLIINARDAMPDGGQLTIETNNCYLDAEFCRHNLEVSPGYFVQLIVSDSGEGMSKIHQEHVFEPFFTTKPQGKGTGLGLSMAFGFIKSSAGLIKLQSEVGAGSAFSIYLPREVSDVDSLQISDKQEQRLPGGNETILAVDDEELLLELAREVLQALGYKVITATNGKQALECLAKEPDITLMFSDVVMPGGISGFDLAKRATANHPDLKVLLTSGYSGKEIINNGRANFTQNLLSKPYSQSELAHRLRVLLD